MKKVKQILVENKPKGISLDEVLMCVDISLDYISEILGVEFEYSEEQCGPLEDCIIDIGDNRFIYIHKWELEPENYTKFNTQILDSPLLKDIKMCVINLLGIKETQIKWVNPKVS